MRWWPFQKRSKTIDEIARELDGMTASSVAGQTVNSTTALRVTTVLACVDAIASGCSVPDLHVMRDLGDNKKEPAKDVAAYDVLFRKPNEWQTAMEFREMLTMHAALTGTGLAIPTFVRGELAELIPIMPQNWIERKIGRYDYRFVVTDEFGPIGEFRPDEVFQIRNRSWEMIKGLDGVQQARSAIGLAMATEANIAKLHENGGRPSGIISTDQNLGVERAKAIKEQFEKSTRGKNAFKTLVLDNNLKFSKMGMSAIDAETNNTRRLQIEEICRGFGVFPQIVMHTDKTTTFASAEAFFAAHNRLTVMKWQKNWREKIDVRLLDAAGPLFAEFDNRVLEAANLKDTATYYKAALGAGGAPPWMTQNEVRAERGLPPLPGGDELFKPSNAVIDDDEEDEDEDEITPSDQRLQIVS